jgi:hypothetical protein
MLIALLNAAHALTAAPAHAVAVVDMEWVVVPTPAKKPWMLLMP